jgi:hypothetical protein
MVTDRNQTVEISSFSESVITIELKTKEPYSYMNISLINHQPLEFNRHSSLPDGFDESFEFL